MIINFVAVFIIFFSFAYLWVNRRFRYWQDRGFLQAKPSFPMGTLNGFGTKMTLAENLDIYYKKFKGKTHAVGLYSLLSPVILPIDTELIKNILVRDFQSFHDRGFFYNKQDDPISPNILTLDGKEWKDRRVKLSPIFTSGKMKMMFDILDAISEKFVEIIGNESLKLDKIEIRSWLQRFTTDNIGNVAFGIEPNCLENENAEFDYYGKRLVNTTFRENLEFVFGSQWPDLARKLHFRFVPKDVGDFFLKTFKEAIEYRENNPINRTDFVSLLLGLKDQLTRNELAAEAFLVYVGGFETSSTLMTFTLYELAMNPDVQDRLRQEVTTAIEENGGKLNYDLLFSLKYLDMVVNEALRKYPPIPNQFRKCTSDYKIPHSKLVIPKGTTILINSYSFQRDAEYFPDPEKFDPERFSDENIRNIKPFTNIPFGDGPRNCLGMRFGLMQSKIGIAKLVKNFIISTTDKTVIPMKFIPTSPFLAPEGGMWLNFKKVY